MDNQQIKNFIETSRQSGISDDKIVSYLQSKGVNLQGQQEQPKTMTGLEKAPFQATGQENLITGTAKAVGNLPKSTFELGKNVVKAVVNPIDTIKSISTVVKGAGAKVGEFALENTDIGQKLLEQANQNRIKQGLPELKRDSSGKLQAEETPDLQAFKQVGQFFSDRYGNLEKFKETVIEDPASVLADVATVLTGGGALVLKAGQVSKVGELSKVGQTISATGQKLEPITAITKTTKNIKNTVKNSTTGRIASEVIPTATDIQRNQVVKALDLTQGDLASISKKTGNDVTDFIVSKELIKETPEQIADSLNDFRKSTRELRNNEISRVSPMTAYNKTDVPFVYKGLEEVKKGIDGIVGLENEVAKIDNLLTKEQLSLDEIQLAKDLIDDNSSIYSKLGDVKSSATAKGLDKLRKDTKVFIEDEVSRLTNGETNIKQLNNDIQTSYAIEDAINTRSTRNLTRAKISLGDWAALGVGTTINPALGIGLYIGKKIIETPSFRLAFVKALNAQPVKNIRKILNEVKNKTVSQETQKLINQLSDEARNNLQIIESGSTILDKTKSKKTQQTAQ